MSHLHRSPTRTNLPMSSSLAPQSAATGRSVTKFYVRKYMCDCARFCKRLRSVKKTAFYDHAPYRTTPNSDLIVVVQRDQAGPSAIGRTASSAAPAQVCVLLNPWCIILMRSLQRATASSHRSGRGTASLNQRIPQVDIRIL